MKTNIDSAETGESCTQGVACHVEVHRAAHLTIQRFQSLNELVPDGIVCVGKSCMNLDGRIVRKFCSVTNVEVGDPIRDRIRHSASKCDNDSVKIR